MSFARGATPDDAAPVGGRGDDPRDVRAVPVAVAEVLRGLAGAEVDAVDVVDVAVAVVVGAVAGQLAEVGPDVRRQVGMVELGAGVDDRDDRARALRQPPGARQVEHAARGEGPLLVLQRLGRHARGARPPAAHQVADRLQAEPLGRVGLGGEDVAVLCLREREWLGADARERAPQRAAAEIFEQRAGVAGIEPDPPAAQRADGLAAQAAAAAHRDAVAAGPQGLGVDVRERLVLGEVLVADDDPRSFTCASRSRPGRWRRRTRRRPPPAAGRRSPAG